MPEVFEELTLTVFYRMVRGYYRRMEDHERPVRRLAALIANVNRPAEHPGYEPQDMWPMRCDPPPPPPSPPATPEETAALLAALDELDKDLL